MTRASNSRRAPSVVTGASTTPRGLRSRLRRIMDDRSQRKCAAALSVHADAIAQVPAHLHKPIMGLLEARRLSGWYYTTFFIDGWRPKEAEYTTMSMVIAFRKGEDMAIDNHWCDHIFNWRHNGT